MGELAEKLRAVLEPSLHSGEELTGSCIATQVGIFKGRMVAVGVTPTRLILQGCNRKWEPDGAPTLLAPEAIADVSVGGAGGGWVHISALIMDSAAISLKLRTTAGEKLKLTMMRGTGPLGGLGGGADQRHGIEALSTWFGSHA
jgi:hypothetical protein